MKCIVRDGIEFLFRQQKVGGNESYVPQQEESQPVLMAIAAIRNRIRSKNRLDAQLSEAGFIEVQLYEKQTYNWGEQIHHKTIIPYLMSRKNGLLSREE